MCISFLLQVFSYSLTGSEQPSELPVYKPIGRCYNTNSGDVAFINERYRVEPDCVINRPEQTFRLSSHDSTLLNSARFLALRIAHTLAGGIPALKDLCIIGYPLSTKFSKPQLNVVPTLNPSNTISTSTPVSTNRKPATENFHSAEADGDNTPHEFKDSLTYEMMSLPIILPSGYTVDQSTLDKHISAEKTWNRKPADPFTGLPLTESNPPIINHLLKERIDRYVLVNNVSVGRTTGRKRPIDADHQSILVEDLPTASKHTKLSNKTKTVSYSSTSALSDEEMTYSELEPQSAKHTADKPTLFSGRLSKVLAKSSCYRTVEIPHKQSPQCAVCKDATTADAVLYKLGSCTHLLCRNCLLIGTVNTGVTCTKCAILTVRSNVIRFHTP